MLAESLLETDIEKDTLLEANMGSIECSMSPLPVSPADFPSVQRRYYTSFYCPKEHVQVMLHSNRLCVVCLAPGHPALRSSVVSVDYRVSKRLNRLDSNVRGKGKKGGQVVDERAVLAVFELDDGSKHVLRSGVRGKLLEVNERLIKEPNLVNRSTDNEGFVAVVLAKVPDGIDHLKKTLVQSEQYEDRLHDSDEVERKVCQSAESSNLGAL